MRMWKNHRRKIMG